MPEDNSAYSTPLRRRLMIRLTGSIGLELALPRLEP